MLYGELLINNGWMIFTMASGISLLSPRPVPFTDIRYAIAVHRGAAGQGPGPPSSCQDGDAENAGLEYAGLENTAPTWNEKSREHR